MWWMGLRLPLSFPNWVTRTWKRLYKENTVLRTYCWVFSCAWTHAKSFPFIAFKPYNSKKRILLTSFRNRKLSSKGPRLEFCCPKPRSTNHCWQPLESRKEAWGRFSLWAPWKKLTLLTACFQTPGLLNSERIISIVLTYPVCDTWCGPRK